MFTRLLAIAVSGLLVGCASVQSQKPSYKSGNFPAIGTKTTVTVGQVMVAKYDYLSLGIATMRESVEGSFWTGRQGLGAGSQLSPAVSAGADVFCQPPPRLGAPCLKDTNNDNVFDIAYTMNAYGFLVNETKIPGARYRVDDRSIKDGFKYELLYQGVGGGVARIAYREYTDSLARPAFSQDLTYTLASNADTAARFRNVSIVIHSADNSGISYTVQSGF